MQANSRHAVALAGISLVLVATAASGETSQDIREKCAFDDSTPICRAYQLGYDDGWSDLCEEIRAVNWEMHDTLKLERLC